MKKTFTLTNELHGTSVKVRFEVGGETVLLPHTVRRVRNTLCPTAGDCTCKADALHGKGPFMSATAREDGSVVVVTAPAPVVEKRKPGRPKKVVAPVVAEAAPTEATPTEAAPAPVQTEATPA